MAWGLSEEEEGWWKGGEIGRVVCGMHHEGLATTKAKSIRNRKLSVWELLLWESEELGG